MTEETNARPSPDIEAIRSRVKAATKGPWKCFDAFDDYKKRGVIVARFGNDTEEVVTVNESADLIAKEHDWHFIAHARTDIPALLALVDELRGRVKLADELAERLEKDTDHTGIGENCGLCTALRNFRRPAQNQEDR